MGKYYTEEEVKKLLEEQRENLPEPILCVPVEKVDQVLNEMKEVYLYPERFGVILKAKLFTDGK